MPILGSNDLTITIKAVDAASDKLDKVSQKIDSSNKSWFKSSALIGAAAGVVQNVANRAFSDLNSLMGDAVSRVDTLNNFPRIMENFGVGAGDAKRMIDTLDKGVRGLPTSLDSIAQLAEGFVPLTKNTDEAALTALALNNAILAGGAPAQVQAAAFEQFRQALSKGIPDLQDWKSLESAMPAQLQQVSEKLGLGSGALAGYTKNGQGLYNAMKDGKLTMEDFNQALVNLNENGINGLPNFASQAKNATQGISTGFENAKTAVVRGMATIIQAVGSANISNALSTLGRGIEFVFTTIAGLVRVATPMLPLFAGIASAFVAYKSALLAANAVTTIHSALIYLMGTRYIVMNGSIIAVKGAVTAATVAQGAWNAVMSMNPIGLLVGAIAGLIAILSLSSVSTDNEADSASRLNAARQQQIDLAEAAKQKEDELRDASLGVEGANLRLEHATQNYNDAVTQYGPNSLQARDAALQLKQANNDLASATEDLDKKQQSQLITLGQLNVDLDKLNGKSVSYTINGQSVGAWKQNGQAFFGGSFDSGGFTGRGGVYEVAGVVHRGEYVIPQKDVDQSTGLPKTMPVSSTSGNGASLNVENYNVYNNVDHQQVLRDIGWRLRIA